MRTVNNRQIHVMILFFEINCDVNATSWCNNTSGLGLKMTRQWSKFHVWTGNEKLWVENSEYVEEDLTYLLTLEASEFWDKVNDSHCNELLDSCLIHLPRYSSEAMAYPEALHSNLERIYRRVFLVFLRLSTHKEKPFSSPEEFGNVLYNNFIISLPQIFDLCNLFYGANRSLLRDMLDNIFKRQPKYLSHDLSMAVELMTQMMGVDTNEATALDTFKSIHNFLSLYPKGAKIFYEKEFHTKAAEFYAQHLSKISSQTGKLARDFLLTSVRLIIRTQLLSPENLSDSFQKYQDLFLQLIPEENFIVDYDAKYPVSEDIQLFTSQNPELDFKGIEYILEGVSRSRASLTERIITKSAQVETAEINSSSPVIMVKETLPELGEGFIVACLDHFGGDPAKVVDALFEDKLPPHLAEMDRSKILNSTKKAPAPRKSVAILDDKSFMADENMKSFYQVRGLVSDVVLNIQGDEEGNEYDDEYDDTYDDQGYGLEEPDPYSERRAFVLPRALGGGHVGRTAPENEESEEDGDENKKPSLDFCRNPEEVREEKERKRQAKYHGGGRGASGGGGFYGNVVGNKKGQGQDKSVLINRARKNASKNKGQRIGADRKMAKGMF